MVIYLRRNAYYWNYIGKIGSYYYGDQHPMKPERIKMAHQLIVGYGLYRQMNIYEPHYSTFNELTWFHTPDYITYIDNQSKNKEMMNIVKTCKTYTKLL